MNIIVRTCEVYIKSNKKKSAENVLFYANSSGKCSEGGQMLCLCLEPTTCIMSVRFGTSLNDLK